MFEQPGREHRIWPVVRVTSGNFLELYDFQIIAYDARRLSMLSTQ
jgi:hypothetical protein